MLEVLVAHSCPVVIGGDINVRVNNVDDIDARRLADLLSTFDVVQHVNTPTHSCGGTLDLMTFADYMPDTVSVDLLEMVSDHVLVICRLLATIGQASTAERLIRGWRRVDRTVFRRAARQSAMSTSDNLCRMTLT